MPLQNPQRKNRDVTREKVRARLLPSGSRNNPPPAGEAFESSGFEMGTGLKAMFGLGMGLGDVLGNDQ